MMTVADLAAWLERLAPPWLAEPWDNVGLLLGELDSPCRRVMTCLTVTVDTADEAVEEGVDLIISHHPILFKGIKRLRADRPETAPVWRLARAGVSLYSPHTAFDNAEQGINAGLALRLGLMEIVPLRPSPPRPLHKVVVFCPKADREPLLEAAFAAGAGRIGAYGECSYTSSGVGTFYGDDSTNPTIGERGRREAVRERRVEVICPGERLSGVLDAIRSAHSYEEPAIDVYAVETGRAGPGVGRVGRLASPETLKEFTNRVARVLSAQGLQYVGDPSRVVERVALGCGAADDFLPDAVRAGADVYLTGEARFHRALEAESLGIALILAGHHATERPAVEDLALRLAEAYPTLKVWASRRERDPLRGLSVGEDPPKKEPPV